jgi:hypothetical protein
MLHKKQWIKLAGTLALASATLGLGPVALAGTPAVAPQDLGVTAPATTETVSIVLKVKNPGLLDDYIDASVDPRRLHRRKRGSAKPALPPVLECGSIQPAVRSIGY